MKRHPVSSSNVVSIGYDAATLVLEVEFKSAIYQYKNVPMSAFDDLMATNSIGRFIHTHILGKFNFVKL